jgi:hypothetical protein
LIGEAYLMKTIIILFTLLLAFSTIAADQCDELRKEIKVIDAQINKKDISCSNNPGKFAPYCKMNLSELKEAFRKKMNEFIILDGVKGIKNAIEGDAKEITLLKKIELDEVDRRLSNFEFSLTRGALTQESFYANTDDKFFFLGFDQHLIDNGHKKFSKDAVENYFDNKCSEKTKFSVCTTYNEAKSKYAGDPDKWTKILDSLFGLGKATANLSKDRSTSELKTKFGNYISYLDIAVDNGGSTTDNQKAVEVLNSEMMSDLRSSITKMKSNPTKMGAKKLNQAATQIKDKLLSLSEGYVDYEKDEKTLADTKKQTREAYQLLELNLKAVIVETKDFDPKSLEESIKSVQKQIKDAKEISQLKLKQLAGGIFKDIAKEFDVSCSTTDVKKCRDKIQLYADKDCDGEVLCEAQKDRAETFVKSLDQHLDNNDIAELEKAQTCYESSDTVKDPSKLLTCLNISESDLNRKLVTYKKDLGNMQELIDQAEDSSDMKRMNLLKSYTIYNLRNTKDCKMDKKSFKINTQCKSVNVLDDTAVNALLGDGGEVLSFYNFDTYKYELQQDLDTLKKLCAMDEYKDKFAATCSTALLLKPINYNNFIKTFDNPYDDFSPDYEAWGKKMRESKANSPGGLSGVASGFIGGFLPGYSDYQQSSQDYSRMADWAISSKQQQLYWDTHKDNIYEDMYIWQQNAYYYPSFAGGKWDYYTDPFNPNFNHEAGPYVYPASPGLSTAGNFNFQTPQANLTNGMEFLGQ